MKLIFSLSLLLSFSSFTFSYLVIPFNIYNTKNNLNDNNNNFQSKDFFLQENQNLVTTNMLTGTPQKNLELYISMEKYYFFMGKGYCFPLSLSKTEYNPDNSNITKVSGMEFNSREISKAKEIKEKFVLYSSINISDSITVNNLEILCGEATNIFNIYSKEKYCGYIGLRLDLGNDYFQSYNFIMTMKFNSYINNYKFSFLFDENNKEKNVDGKFLIGLEEEDYKEIFGNEMNYTNININHRLSGTYWDITFSKIYYNYKGNNIQFDDFNSNIDNVKYYLQGNLMIDYNYIISNEQFFLSLKNNFFIEYINKDICSLESIELTDYSTNIKKNLIYISCNKNKISLSHLIESFPLLNFYQRELNKNFVIEGKEVFELLGNDKIFFKIIYDENNPKYWTFGRIFLKKYQFVFDYDNKIITFIERNDENKNNNWNDNGNNKKLDEKIDKNIVWKILVIIVLLVGLGSGIFIGKKIWDKTRKKKANELEDEYDYNDGLESKGDSINKVM